MANSVPGAYLARESSRVRCGVMVGAGAGVGHQPGADRVAEVDDARPGAHSGTRRLHSPTAAVRLLDHAHAAELDLIDECQAEVLHQQPADLGLRGLGRRHVEAEAGARQSSSVGEADVEVEVGAILGHAASLEPAGSRRLPHIVGFPPFPRVVERADRPAGR
nr:hypothetical protein GCM10025699_11420 [Microbacterium flavescens]